MLKLLSILVLSLSLLSCGNKKPNKFARFKGLVFKHLETFDYSDVSKKINDNYKCDYKGGRYD